MARRGGSYRCEEIGNVVKIDDAITQPAEKIKDSGLVERPVDVADSDDKPKKTPLWPRASGRKRE